jgi:5-methylcytosine-specific restriction protein A
MCAKCSAVDCQTHKLLAQASQKDVMRERRKNDPFAALYKTARWRVMRLRLLAATPVCTECANALATDIDHHINAKTWCAAGNDFWNESNLMPLCHSCHSSKTAKECGFAGTHNE